MNRKLYLTDRLMERLIVMAVIGWAAIGTAAFASEADPADKPHPSRIIQYRGYMPQLSREKWGQTVDIKFEL